MAWIDIAGHKVGSGQPCFIVAEAGVNHDGNLDLAYKMVDAAAQAGADAIKFQTFRTERLTTPDAPKAEYQLQNTDASESQYDMLRRLELSEEEHRHLLAHCQRQDILFMSTPFDEESVDLLVELGVAVLKVPSGEVTNSPFLTYVAGKGKPLIISTGTSNLAEVAAAVHTVEAVGNQEYVLLHCVSNYPANPADVNLRAMDTMRAAFCTPVGYSDHTLGLEVAIAAVARGACVVEKHITLDRDLPGPDQRASLEPAELADLVNRIRIVESALGDGRKLPAASEANTAAVIRKSLVAADNLPAGTVLSKEMIAAKRPGVGLPPSMQCHLTGRTLNQDVTAGTLLSWEMLS